MTIEELIKSARSIAPTLPKTVMYGSWGDTREFDSEVAKLLVEMAQALEHTKIEADTYRQQIVKMRKELDKARGSSLGKWGMP